MALEILTKELDRTGLDIVTLQEVRWPGEGKFGTGFLVRRSILLAIRDIKFVSDRIYIILKSKRHDFIIVNVYGPIEASDDTIKDEFYEELSRCHMKIVLGDFNAKVGREDIFRPTIGKYSLHEDSNDNGVRLVTFATSKNLIVKSTTFQHKDIHKYTWTSPDGETRNQIDHVLVDKGRHIRGLDCNSDHHLVRLKIRERLALTRGTDTKDDSQKFELKNLRNDESVGHLKKRQSRKWFDEECVDMLHKRKLAKMNWMREPNEQNSEQLWFQARTNIIKNENGDMLADAKSILNRWGNYFNQLLNNFSIRQILENKLEYNGTIHQLYVYFKKAYDSIKRETLYRILTNFGIPKKLVRLIGMCLNGTKSRVPVGKQVSDIFEIHNGLKQGDALSPLLFNFVLEHVIKSLEDKEGVQLNGNHKLLVYADDIVLLGGSEEILNDNMHILRSNTKKLGLEVNVNKTKYMVTRRNVSCNANGQLITNEGNFLRRALITNRNEIQKEIKHSDSYHRSFFQKNIKLKIYKTVILPVILYGCETWTLTLRGEKILRVFENKVLRKFFGPKRDEETGEFRRIHNTELKDLYGKPDII
ncbi:hypothetical protein C0J52_13676 [Blattella germanica]|nr:hypothetical protein C0J52_13676 [Blattella germanica]